MKWSFGLLKIFMTTPILLMTQKYLHETDMTGQVDYKNLAKTSKTCICSSPQCEIS